MRGLLTGGVALILLGGSQAGPYALGHVTMAPGADSRAPAQAVGTQPISATMQPLQPSGNAIDGGSPPLGSRGTPPQTGSGPVRTTHGSPTAGSHTGGTQVVGGVPIPTTVLAAYLGAARRLAASEPGCHLPWQLLAAIGRVESGHAEGGNVTADGTARTPILGPPLNGNGFAAIRSADGSWARAEGPMQFIPSTWAIWGTDGNGDGKADPENVFDATLSAGDYLCSGGRDLSNSADLERAILGYNDSQTYVADVLAWMRYYQHNGATPAVDGSTSNQNTAPGDTSRNAAGTPTTDPTPSGQRTGRQPGTSPHDRPTGSTPSSRPSPIPSQPSPTPSQPSPTSSRPTGSSPAAPTGSPSPSVGATSSQPASPGSSPTGGPSSSAPPSASQFPSPSPTPSPTQSPSSLCPDPSPSPTESTSPTASPTPSPTATSSESPSDSPTASPSPSASPTATCP